MMADLVGDHIGLREVAGGVELPLELLEKGGVEIDLAVVGTVERSRSRRRIAAGRTDLSRKQHQRRLLIGQALRLEDAVPDVLRLGQHRRHELRHLVGGRGLAFG
jgi:hypothetical protein